MELVSEAIMFAARAHDGMRRKSTQAPYILHPVEAAAIAGSMSTDQEIIAAAALHDVVEDTEVSLEQIEGLFGKRVAALVGDESEDKRVGVPPAQTWRLRKEETIEVLRRTDDIAVKIVCLGDKLSNMRSIYRDHLVLGDALWQRFNQKDPAEHGWYYRTIAECTSELKDYPAWQEYDELIKIVFERGKS